MLYLRHISLLLGTLLIYRGYLHSEVTKSNNSELTFYRTTSCIFTVCTQYNVASFFVGFKKILLHCVECFIVTFTQKCHKRSKKVVIFNISSLFYTIGDTAYKG